MNKHTLITLFEDLSRGAQSKAEGILSDDGSAITYSLTRYIKENIKPSLFANKLQQSSNVDMINDDFGIRFSKKMDNYMVHCEIEFFDDHSSLIVNIFTSGPSSDHTDSIEGLATNLIKEMELFSSIAKQSF